MDETIFALSSGQPPAAIALIRISGTGAAAAARALAGRLPPPRRASLATLRHPVSGLALDRAVLIYFPGPKSATGEELVEIQCHGGRAVVKAIESALAGITGLRPAQPGEFTRRAFENGRIDLNEAEGLADLLFAETESQRRAALSMSDGHFSRRVADWRARLLSVSALVEACLDFSDEDDVPSSGADRAVRDECLALGREIADDVARPSAERLRDGVRVVLAGPPNAGKSTLLNRLAGRDAAIVSELAGTTRDRIEVPVAIGGTPFLLTDTAGLRELAGDDRIEWQGIERAREAIEGADIIIWLGDPRDAPPGPVIRVAAQSDRPGWTMPEGSDLALSAHSGAGMAELIAMMVERASALLPAEGEYALHARQRNAVVELGELLSLAVGEPDLLVVAEQLRACRAVIDRLTGRAGTEDMLDMLFGGFCIGK